MDTALLPHSLAVLLAQNPIVLFFNAHPWIWFLLMVWAVAWKGIALWKAGRLSHKVWFIVLLLANTAGILEMFYIYFIARKYTVETEEK